MKYEVMDMDSMRVAIEALKNAMDETFGDGTQEATKVPETCRLRFKKAISSVEIDTSKCKFAAERDRFNNDFEQFKTLFTKLGNILLDRAQLLSDYFPEG